MWRTMQIVCVVGVVVCPLSGQSRPPGSTALVTYEQFMLLDAGERLRVYQSLDATNKADVMRAHVRRWLDANRSRLNTLQVSVIEETVDLIGPELYLAPADPRLANKRETIKARVACVLAHDDAIAAFSLNLSPRSGREVKRTWVDGASAGLEWLSNCAEGFIRPAIPK